MDPDHPLLARAQAALRKQLEDRKRDVEERIREKEAELNKEKKRREAVGVELYGVQQNLGKLQQQLDRTIEDQAATARARSQAESDLRQLQEWLEARALDAKEQRRTHDSHQKELDDLNATLRQVEAYNEQMKGEIATTRTATYAAEESATRLEKEKMDQDVLIDVLSENLKRLHQAHALAEAQLIAQRKETGAARATLEEAAREMEAINYEKKQLTAQWKTSLVGMARRDEALQATQEALRKQAEETTMIEAETSAYKRQIKEAEGKNEQLTQQLRKMEAEGEFLSKNIDACREKKERLMETHARLTASLEETEAHLEKAHREAKALDDETNKTEKDIAKTTAESREHDERMLANLSEQTTVEKGVQRTIDATREVRRKIRDQEMYVTTLQNEIAKTRVDVLNTQASLATLDETLVVLDAELAEKSRTVDKYEAEIKRRNDDIAKRARDVDRLNKKLEQLSGGDDDGENLGPMEATIKNMNKEVEQKEKENKELQRRWVNWQTELVTMVNENNELTEKTQRLKQEKTLLTARRNRLDQNLTRQKEECGQLSKAMERMHQDMVRINALRDKNAKLHDALVTDNYVLETEIVGELKDLEVEAVTLESKIEARTEEKKRVVAEVVETERQIMLWERKIQLEKETQAALDPDVGGDVVGAMKKEIGRMETRYNELKKRQERLMQEMEKAVYKRELITTKAMLAAASGKNNSHASSSAAARGLAKAGVKSIEQTDAEARAREASVAELEEERARAVDEIEQTESALRELREREEELRRAHEGVERERVRASLEARKNERMLERFRELEIGTRDRAQLDEETVRAEFEKARHRREKLVDAIGDICADAPHLEAHLDRALTLLSL
ncbi:predicted protein [Micromonas commoda]|uniref:Uncharacterized protein n=1 Tax=Micromonas commoda (strain RCC299 / NOUM17 / CCMP2709) TaxID=296587 RepID=C1ECT2_MICCC|nr:predicted protein [Micromonas commoda]ACO65634.1 predicted protein [Micromonas commoda]|eukprot:XP_002504376.1 predicted protein [Micromonas commoda]